MDPKKLFPDTPDDLTALDDDAVKALLEESEKAVELIVADDAEFLKGLSGDEVNAQFEAAIEPIKAIRSEIAARATAYENYKAKMAELANALAAEDEPEDGDGDEAVTEEIEVVAEADVEETVEETVEERELITASVTAPRYSRTPPAPAADRISVSTVEAQGSALVASGGYKANFPAALDSDTLARLAKEVTSDLGPLAHNEAPGKYVTDVAPYQISTWADGRREEIGGGQIVWDGPRTKMARAEFNFPEERILNGSDDFEKILAVLPETTTFMGRQGQHGGQALVASGGICAPSTPFYSMQNYGTEAEPVWDSLPVFQAARGGVNVPESTYIADITTAISSISEENDALGGTFATKSCQDLTCPSYTETFVNIFAHCREYGNLNARTWPEKIAHENALTMQALARVSEGFMLDRLKALSINVTNGGTGQGSLIYTVEAIVRASFGIRGRLRMPRNARFRWVLPYWVPDILVLDNISTQFDRFRDQESLVGYLRSVGIDPVFYLDTPSSGTTQLPDSAQTAAAIDATPANFQSAFYPEGAFLGIDSGSLELGIVRDSVLNSTNDFQVFGERFRNLVRLAPAQAAYWITTTYCSAGIFPALGTARTCP